MDRVPVAGCIPKEIQIFWSETDSNLRSGHGSVTHRSERRAMESRSGHLQPFLEIGVDLREGIQIVQIVQIHLQGELVLDYAYHGNRGKGVPGGDPVLRGYRNFGFRQIRKHDLEATGQSLSRIIHGFLLSSTRAPRDRARDTTHRIVRASSGTPP